MIKNPSSAKGGANTGSTRGIFVVIEGTDGSGKSTQYNLMHNHLVSEGYEVVKMHFPRYEQDSSYFVREYLGGAYGSSDDVGPYTGSMFYALDRYQAAPEIRQALATGKIVLCDRYVGSNMAHQGTKFDNIEQRRGYFIWLDNLEFQMLGIPRPDANFVLNNPLDIIMERLKAKEDSAEHTKGKDVHEANDDHIKKSLDVYSDLTNLFPKDFIRVDCARGGQSLPPDEIHALLWEKVTPLLPTKPKKEVNMSGENPYIRKLNGGWEITPDGQEFLQESVSDVSGDVYAFTDKLGTTTVAAAMARLSRRGDDMRITILDEFAATEGKDEGLLERVITQYGDDSVQQLTGQHLVVENASNLLTKHIEWGRLASYLEQSTRYINFDSRDENGHYKYYTPETFSPEVSERFEESLNQIFNIYSDLLKNTIDYVRANSSEEESERDAAWRSSTRAQALDAVRPVLPVATKSTVGIYGSAQAIEHMIMRLRAHESAEARKTGNSILQEVRKVNPTFFQRADKPDRGGATSYYLDQTRQKIHEVASKLPERYGDHSDAVRLERFEPKNEYDLIPHMLYDRSNLSLQEIADEVENWTIDEKNEAIQAYVGDRLNRRHKPGRALEMARYTWDLICDYGIFRDLQRHRIVDDLKWQPLTPRYGYEIPQLIEDAGLSDQFERCFDLSANLYSYLQEAGYEFEAQYATLLGHKMRWTVTYNAREAFHLHELRTSPQGHPGYRKLVQQMHEKVRAVHPLIADAMRFVNEGEDPELTRLAAERYTQSKLAQLDKKS